MTSTFSEVLAYFIAILSGIAFFTGVTVAVRTKDRYTRKVALVVFCRLSYTGLRFSGFYEGSSKQAPLTATEEDYQRCPQDRHYWHGYPTAHNGSICTLYEWNIWTSRIPAALLTQIHKPSLFAKDSTRYQKIGLSRILQASNVKYA
jgi:hypothetical protein